MGGVQLKGAQVSKVAGAAPAHAAAQPAKAPAQEQRQADWKLECAHHASHGSREIFVHGNRLEVVPEKLKKSDKVTISYKNEETAPPASLTIGGKSCPKGKPDGKFETYVFDAEYQGNTDQQRFWTSQFWRNFRQGTVHRVENAPLPFEIRVRNPTRYKLEISFPAMKGYKAGEKFSKANEGGFAKLQPTKSVKKEEITGWSPTKLETTSTVDTRNKQNTSTGYRATFEHEEERKTEVAGIAFTIDGTEVKLDLLEALGQLKEVADSLQKIVKSFQENSPKLGWYLEYEFQFLQGTVAAEWNWQEHHDHTAFTYIDVNVQMTCASVTLELGIGISGLGFKAQVYVAFGGSLDVALSGRRDKPAGPPAFVLPAGLAITGTVGARFEVGNLFKANATGKTSLEIKAEYGINRADRESMLTIDSAGEWSGFEVAYTASGGLFAIGGKHTVKKKRLAGPEKLWESGWPSEKKYEPETVSRDRIRQCVLEKLTEGLDVKVATTVRDYWLNDYMDVQKVTDRLLEVIDAHPGFDRKPEVVDGLAAGIRGDLRAIGENDEHSYVTLSQFEDYLAKGLPKRLDAMVPPSDAIVPRAPLAPVAAPAT